MASHIEGERLERLWALIRHEQLCGFDDFVDL